jgi:ECF transporter S component (folate family)
MCLIAVLFALQLCLKLVSLPSGFSNLGIGLTYLIFSTIAMIYGPIWALIIGFLSDVIGFYIIPTGGVFHLGFTLQAMLSGFLYAIFLYKTDLRFSKVLLCRLIINILINGIYGAILMSSILGFDFAGTVTYMLSVALPKNIIYLFPQAILMYYFLKGLSPVLKRRNIIYNNEPMKY